MPKYVLITAVRDEIATIPVTIQSVVSQKVLPEEWVIVSDGSRDGTDEAVMEWSRKHSFIRLVQLKDRPGRGFASVVFALETGARALKCPAYDYIGILDGDIRFPADYYEQVMARFAAEPKLGLAGGLAVDVGEKAATGGRNLADVAGAVQFFRRECFQSLGGLAAIPEGGWDAITCVQARMQGFQTRTLADLHVDHLKPRNVHSGGVLKRSWHMGIRDYAIATHPLYETVKCAMRWKDRPLIAGALARWLAFAWSGLSRRPRILSAETIAFRHREEKALLWSHLKDRLGRRAAGLF
jgi:poly-beta-1,6-N-acetyl-D-glucosamine synthase